MVVSTMERGVPTVAMALVISLGLLAHASKVTMKATEGAAKAQSGMQMGQFIQANGSTIKNTVSGNSNGEMVRVMRAPSEMTRCTGRVFSRGQAVQTTMDVGSTTKKTVKVK